MKYIIHEVALTNRLPEIIPATEAIAYSPAVPATETTPEIPEILAVEAQPKKYKFFATVFITIDGCPSGEFIQGKNFEFIVLGEKTIKEIEAQLLIEVQNYINLNYPETP